MSEVMVQTERVDDIPLLFQQQMELGIAESIDSVVPRHGNRLGLSIGEVTMGWLIYILSKSDHRLSVVEEWAAGRLTTLNRLFATAVRSKDFTDDRLGEVLECLNQDEVWNQLEQRLNKRCVQVYDLEQDTARVDTTMVSMYHDSEGSDVIAYGHSKDYRPDLAQIKVLMVTLDPLALPLVTQVLPGNTADDGLYKPAIATAQATLSRRGMLYVGDSKMEKLAARAHCASTDDYYLHPLSMKGQQGELLHKLVNRVLDDERVELADIHSTAVKPDGSSNLMAQAWETTRSLQATVADEQVQWDERVLVVYSPALAQAGYRRLEQRLQAATEALLALTSPRGRGRRQWQALAPLQTAAEAILKQYRVADCLEVTYERQETIRHIRRYKERPPRTETTVRYQLSLSHNDKAIEAARRFIGWRLFVTNAPQQRLSLERAVRVYHGATPTIEHLFSRLQGQPLGLRPLYVRRDEAIIGLTRLLALALRILTLIEFVVRRSLQQAQDTLAGLVPGNPKIATATPTTERLLHAFNEITLSVIHLGEQTIRHVTPLTPIQYRILLLLKFSDSLYTALALAKPISV